MKNRLSRRNFFKIVGGAGATLVTSSAVNAQSVVAENSSSYGSLVDITRCVGCRKCEMACNAANKLPLKQGFNDMSVFDKERRPDAEHFTVVNKYNSNELTKNDHLKKIFVKDQCRHCNKPSCASACVVGALTKNKNGSVVYDAKKCIGCRYCLIACPFQIPAYEDHNPVTPRVRKCTFCSERLDQNKMPACVTICPTQALIFGKRDKLLKIAKKRIEQNPGKYEDHIYGENEAGGTSWLYLSPVSFSFFPEVEKTPPPELTESILSGVFGYAAAPTALFAILGGIAWITGRKEDNAENEKTRKIKGGK